MMVLVRICLLQVDEFKKSQVVWRKIEEEKIRRENAEIAKFSSLKEEWKGQVIL